MLSWGQWATSAKIVQKELIQTILVVTYSQSYLTLESL